MSSLSLATSSSLPGFSYISSLPITLVCCFILQLLSTIFTKKVSTEYITVDFNDSFDVLIENPTQSIISSIKLNCSSMS